MSGKLASLPAELSHCASLEILNCSQNRLHALPPHFFKAKLQKLKFLHLADNQLEIFPFDEFKGGGEQQDKLQELRAFDVEGNPLLADEAQAAEVEAIAAVRCVCVWSH